MRNELINLFLILIFVLYFGGLEGLFNVFCGTVLVAYLIAYVAVKFFWTDILFSLGKFIFSSIIPRRW